MSHVQTIQDSFAPSDSLTSKTDVDAKIVILSALVKKLLAKTSFFKMVANITHLRTSCANV